MYSESVYSVIADYEKYVEVQQKNGQQAVSIFKYVLGNL